MQLNEGISEIVYHFTDLRNILSILEDDKFYLSTNIGSDADLKTSKNKFYFFSTTRSKSKQYSGRNGKIKLNGKKLGTKYKAFPIDYWQYSKNPKDWGDKSGYRQALLSGEEEDRIISNKPYIENATSYILEIHILIEKNDISRIKQKTINKLLEFSKNIPIYFYKDKKSFLVEDKRNVINIKDYSFKEDESNESSYIERFNLWRVASLLSYNDDDMKNKVVEILLKDYPKDQILNNIEETIKKDKYNYFSWFKTSKISSANYKYIAVIKNEIHNARSSKNILNIEIIQLLVQYMNKYKIKNLTDFIFKKLKGNFKYQDEYKNNLIIEFDRYIDETLNKYIDQYNEYRYRVGNYTYHNIFYEFPELKKFLANQLNKVKEYIKSIILNKDIEFVYISGQIQKPYILDYIKLNNINFNNILNDPTYKESGENFDLSEDLIDDLKRIIENVVGDVDYDAYKLVKKYIDEYENQYKIKESLYESINPESSYSFNVFKKNNKIGFYNFKNIDDIEYEVRMSKYIDNINGIDSNILDIEFAADNNWKQSSKVKDTFKVFSTIGAILKDYYDDNIDYITYVLDRNDNPEKRNKIYQYIIKNIGLNISNIIKIGSNVYLKIDKGNN